MWSGLTLGPFLCTYSHKSFSISYKIANCRDALFLCTKTFFLVVRLFLDKILILRTRMKMYMGPGVFQFYRQMCILQNSRK